MENGDGTRFFDHTFDDGQRFLSLAGRFQQGLVAAAGDLYMKMCQDFRPVPGRFLQAPQPAGLACN